MIVGCWNCVAFDVVVVTTSVVDGVVGVVVDDVVVDQV